MLLTVQKTKESSESHHLSVATESSEAGPAGAAQDAGLDRATQINCGVKEEANADGQEMGERMQHQNFKSLGVCVAGRDSLREVVSGLRLLK